MRLPYSHRGDTIPAKDAWSPVEFLARDLACPECGRAASYTARDVQWKPAAVSHGGPKDVICWRVEATCNEERCDLPIEFHFLSAAEKGKAEMRLLMLRLFERGFFRKLTCGRGHPPDKTAVRDVQKISD